jgi:hypothetical protein
MNFEFDLTYKCNLACKWCNQLCGTKYRRPDDISIEQLEKYINVVAPYIERRNSIRIVGGEPTLHPQIFEALDIFIKILRPLTQFAINIVSNGYGQKVNRILQQIREKYDTCDNPHLRMDMLNIRPPSSKQFVIVTSKEYPDKYINAVHRPIFRSAIDFKSQHEIDLFAKTCEMSRVSGYKVTPIGIFVCCLGNPIATLFKLGNGFDHVPSEKEVDKQKKEICKYCSFACDPNKTAYEAFTIVPKPEISPTHEKILKEWER